MAGEEPPHTLHPQKAYNLYGGANVYYGLEPPYRRAYKVSYNRPFQTRATRAVNILFGAEYPMIRWIFPPSLLYFQVA